MSKLKILIPSSGRPSTQTTFDRLPASLKKNVHIVVPEKEASAYSGNGYPCIGAPVGRIGSSRQWCVEQGEYVVMLDDDLIFATRRVDDPTKFLPATDEAIELMFDEIALSLKHFAHVGVGSREGGNRRTEKHCEIGRMTRILGYKTSVLRKNNIRFDEMPVMEDFDVTLRLLRLGYPNRIINWIVHDQKGSNSAGGCSQFRTKELQEKASRMLASRHTQFVTVVQKETKGAWGGGVRTDVRVQWRRAYDSS